MEGITGGSLYPPPQAPEDPPRAPDLFNPPSQTKAMLWGDSRPPPGPKSGSANMRLSPPTLLPTLPPSLEGILINMVFFPSPHFRGYFNNPGDCVKGNRPTRPVLTLSLFVGHSQA